MDRMRIQPSIAALTLLATIAGAQTTKAPRVVRLTAAEIARRADSARAATSVQLAPGLAATPWAVEGLVADPIAVDVDGRGVVYVTGSARSGGVGSPLDI